jgi:hypothetical protein
MRTRLIAAAGASALLALCTTAHAATLVASYGFDNTLASSYPGGPTLGVVDPEGTSGFVTDTVGSDTRTVYHVGGINSPPADQGGLTFDGSSVLDPTQGYSVEMTFEFVPGTDDRDGAWRRILDSQNRTSDTGLYADPSNQLDIYPVAGTSSAAFVAGAYRNVVLTVGAAATPTSFVSVSAYIDGGHSFTTTTNVMDLQSGNLLGLFLDNTSGGGQGEWAPVNIATLNVFSGVLTADEAEAFAGDAYVPPSNTPEPGAWALMIAGLGLTGAALRRRQRLAIA